MLNRARTLWRLYRLNGLQGTLRRVQLQMGWRRYGTDPATSEAHASAQQELATPPLQDSIAVYTAQYGSAHALPTPTNKLPHICFTDVLAFRADGWDVRYMPMADTSRRAARRLKLLPHHFLHEFDWWVWHDASLQLTTSAAALACQCLESGRELATFRHPERDCVYREAEAVNWYHLDDPRVVESQVNRYRQIGFPSRFGLLETALLVRRNVPAVRELNEAWFEELSQGSERDQLSLMPCLWQSGLKWHELEGCREDNPYSQYDAATLGGGRSSC